MEDCCVVCEMKEAVIPVPVVQSLLHVDVHKIAKMEDAHVKSICHQLSPSEMVILKNAANRLLNKLGLNEAKFIHQRFHQKSTLETVLPFRFLESGSILQILSDCWPPGFTNTLVLSLIEQSVWSYAEASKYPTLNVRMHDAISIDIVNGYIQLHRYNGWNTTLEGIFDGMSFPDKLDYMERYLTPMDSPSLIVIHGAEQCDDDDIPNSQQWIDFLKRIYGDLKDIWIVLIFRELWLPGWHRQLSPENSFRSLLSNAHEDTLRNSKLVQILGTTITAVELEAA